MRARNLAVWLARSHIMKAVAEFVLIIFLDAKNCQIVFFSSKKAFKGLVLSTTSWAK